MKITMALKVRLYPNCTQELQLNKTLNSCRYIYNHMLSRQQKVFKRRGEHLSYVDMSNLLPKMKNYLPWLKDADSQALKYTCRQLDNAYKKFFNEHRGFPKFKSKRGRQSFTTTNGKSIHIDFDNRKIKLPLLKWVKCRGLRYLPKDAIIKQATVSLEADKYYCSITYSYEADIDTFSKRPKYIGLDYKISGLYVDSNGNLCGKPKHFKESLDKLVKAQYKLSLKQGSHKGERKSKRYIKQLKRVNKIQKHISNQRKDFLHKTSTAIIKQYDVIGIEDISIKDMYAKYFDTKNHKAEHNINHTIADDGWYMFTKMLEYKAKLHGKKLIEVSKDFKSTEICSSCGHLKEMPLNIRIYRCPNCGFKLNRDINAAINIKNECMRLLTA